MDQVPHFIGGLKVFGRNDRSGEVFNPATGKCTAQVAFAGTAEVDLAVTAAAKAFAAWASTAPLHRARVMFKFKDLLERDAESLAVLITS